MSSKTKRIPVFLVLLILSAFYGISTERTRAFLAAQSERADELIAQGLHPWSLAFESNAWVDPRTALIGERAFAGRLWKENNQFYAAGKDGAFELRLNLRGALLHPEDLLGFELGVALPANVAATPDRENQSESPMIDPALAPVSICLLVQPQSSNVVLTSTRCFSANQVQDLTAMSFANVDQKIAPQSWLDLGAIKFISVYVSHVGIKALQIRHLNFSLAKWIERMELNAALPEGSLLAADEIRLQAGVWPAMQAVAWWPSLASLATVNVMLLTIFLIPYALSFAAEHPSLLAKSRAVCLTLLCLMAALLVLFTRDSAQLVDMHNKPGVFAAGSVLVAAVLVWISFWRPWAVRDLAVSLKRGWVPASLFCGAMVFVLLVGFGTPEAASLRLVGNYLVFAWLQQFLLSRLLISFRRAALGRPASVLISASIFALLHAPNFMLMCLCFLAALYWCTHYLRYRNIWPLVLSHAVLGWCATTIIPNDILRNAKIGFGFFIN
jgi:hypothetical protein